VTGRKIIIDTDPGIDDAMAIFFALESPELDVVALTTVFGNHTTEVCTRNALKLLEVAERTDIPVARGADRPLNQPYRGPADFVHGDDGQGNTWLAEPTTVVSGEHAAHLIARTVMDNPGEITLCPIGPLTNIALALLMEPRLAANVREIVLMGGNAFCNGNASPAAEANILNDPEAADVVFAAECQITMAGLDVTEATVMTAADLARYDTVDTAMGRHIAAIVPYYHAFYRERCDLDGIFVHDSAVITYLLAPELFRWRQHPVCVDTGASVCRGKTLPALRISDNEQRWADRRDVRILTEIDARAAIELEFTRLGQG
jgi:inosine-uridine nucleoside N-ribohydrolase